MAQCYRHNWVGLPGEMCPRCCDEAAALTARLASLESDLARVTADNERLVAELYLREDPSAKIAEVCRERDRVTAEKEAAFDCHPGDGVSFCGACMSCLNHEIERAGQLIAAHEWIDDHTVGRCPECGRVKPGDSASAEFEGHNPGCAWGEAAKRGQMPGGEG